MPLAIVPSSRAGKPVKSRTLTLMSDNELGDILEADCIINLSQNYCFFVVLQTPAQGK